jgi:anti-sigma factor RsiW
MRCKKIGLWIIAATEGDLPDKAGQAVEEHLASCEACVGFKRDLETLRQRLTALPEPKLSELVAAETRTKCRAALKSDRRLATALAAGWRRLPIPRLIWAVIPVLVLLTAVIMAFGLQELAEESASLLSAAVLTMVLQNATMLVFAPILLKAWRRKRSPSAWDSRGVHAS